MYNSSTFGNPHKQINAYLAKDIFESSQEKLLIRVYDFAITNCKKGEMVKTNNAIGELISALNFDDPKAKPISVGLMKLYQFCQEQMRQKNTEVVYKILSDLRDTWLTVFKKAA